MTGPDHQALEWAASAVGSGARVVGVEAARPDTGTWFLRIAHAGSVVDAVLKAGQPEWRPAYVCEAAALECAAAHELPAPRLLGLCVDGVEGVPAALLMTRLAGSSTLLRAPTAEQLRGVGNMAAAVHRIAMSPSRDLPLRTRHTSWTDYALWRRLATRYRSGLESNRPDPLAECLPDLPGWDRESAHSMLMGMDSTPLLRAADDLVHAVPVPDGPTVLVHGDLWHGNVMWVDGRCVGLIDWETAGVGHYGVDLGCLRWDAALLFGPWASGEVLAGWEEASGQGATSVAYWDIVSALNAPAGLGELLPSFHAAGRTDLDLATVTDRRDTFLKDAVDRLERDQRSVAG